MAAEKKEFKFIYNQSVAQQLSYCLLYTSSIWIDLKCAAAVGLVIVIPLLPIILIRISIFLDRKKGVSEYSEWQQLIIIYCVIYSIMNYEYNTIGGHL
jgi:hypothetical protein